MACRRNAFVMLYTCDQQRAIDYLGGVIDQVGNFPESLQLVIIELIRKVCRSAPTERVRRRERLPQPRFVRARALTPCALAVTASGKGPRARRRGPAQVCQVRVRLDELGLAGGQVRERGGADGPHECPHGCERYECAASRAGPRFPWEGGVGGGGAGNDRLQRVVTRCTKEKFSRARGRTRGRDHSGCDLLRELDFERVGQQRQTDCAGPHPRAAREARPRFGRPHHGHSPRSGEVRLACAPAPRAGAAPAS